MKIDIEQLEFVDKKLREILLSIEQQTGFELTITSLYRIGDHGVHGTLPLRGTDIRTRDKATGKSLEHLINRIWQYDPERPEKKCAILHGRGSNMHLHLQVHENTVSII